MSKYTAAWLVTYGGSAALFLVALILAILAVYHNGPTVPMTPMFCFFSVVFGLASRHVLREGRTQLASDHWRAEDFQ